MLLYYNGELDLESSTYCNLQNIFMCCDFYSEMQSDTKAVFSILPGSRKREVLSQCKLLADELRSRSGLHFIAIFLQQPKF